MPFKYLRRYRKFAGLLAGPFALSAGVLLTGAAIADVGNQSWIRFGNEPGASTGPYTDRSLEREWEAQPPRGFPTLSKSNLGPLEAAIRHYQAIVAQDGGWRPMPMLKLRPGVRHGSVAYLRRRLEMTRDLAPGRGYSTFYDGALAEAVRTFQMRHGLTPTGIVDKPTVLALNVPAEARLSQLKINLARLRTLVGSAAKKYVVVNIPAAQIEAVDNDEVISRHAAVVGKVDRRTPKLRSQIHEINFNPYWHIPQSIVRKDLVPKARLYARRGKDILGEYRIDAYSGGARLNPARIDWNSPAVYSYSYRQQPWKDNSMGFVKINFHNAHAVYMHDTPSKSLFARNFRAHSSGCVRVQNVKQLVSWLLEANGGWDLGAIQQIEQTGARRDVNLKRPVPVYFVYVTAWVTRDGTVNFRRDMYGDDHVGVTASAY